MKHIFTIGLLVGAILTSYQASARCTNVSGDPSFDAYCSILQAEICKPEYSGGKCVNVVIGRCTNISGDRTYDSYCSILQNDICKPEYSGGKCMLIVN